MAYVLCDASNQWPNSAQYTASSDIDILIVNPTNSPLHWVTTIDDASPGSGGSPLRQTAAAKVPAAGERSLSLLSGERLWLTYPHITETESVSVTLQT